MSKKIQVFCEDEMVVFRISDNNTATELKFHAKDAKNISEAIDEAIGEAETNIGVKNGTVKRSGSMIMYSYPMPKSFEEWVNDEQDKKDRIKQECLDKLYEKPEFLNRCGLYRISETSKLTTHIKS